MHASLLNRMNARIATFWASFVATMAGLVDWANARVESTLGVRSLAHDTRGDAMRDVAIGGILVILSFVIVLAFWPVLTSSINTAQDDPNTSETAGTTLGLIPLTFAAALLISGVAFLVKGVKELA